AVMLVETDPVIAEMVERLPGVEMLGVGALRRLRVEMALRQRVGQFGAALLQMIEIGVVGQQIEDEYLHCAASFAVTSLARSPRNTSRAVAIAAIRAKPQALRKISRGGRPLASR